MLWAAGTHGGIAVANFAAAIHPGSGSLLAEAIHSLADRARVFFEADLPWRAPR